MPLPMCCSAGAVPQWYTYTPGTFASNVQVKLSPGATLR